MTKQKLISAKRDEILRAASRHGAINVRLFGSFARGEANEESDVDILVEAGSATTPFFPGGLLADLEDLLGCKVDVVTEAALHPYIRERVLEEVVPL
jgi:uncharacterized protein